MWPQVWKWNAIFKKISVYVIEQACWSQRNLRAVFYVALRKSTVFPSEESLSLGFLDWHTPQETRQLYPGDQLVKPKYYTRRRNPATRDNKSWR